ESDWARHALRIDGDIRLERNLSGDALKEKSEGAINSDLRLDLGYDIEAHILGGYKNSKEDVNDPNAIAGIRSQGTEHEWNLGASVSKEFARIHTLNTFDIRRTTYTDAEALDGTAISLSDRARTASTLTSRLGYELS